MPKSALHEKLKEMASDFLRRKKRCLSIDREVAVRIGEKGYIVDVVGYLEDGERIAIECGETELRKLSELNKIFKQVIHFRIIDALDYLENFKKGQEDVDALREENGELLEEVEFLKKELMISPRRSTSKNRTFTVPILPGVDLRKFKGLLEKYGL